MIFETDIESFIFQQIFIIMPKNNIFWDSIDVKSASMETFWSQEFVEEF